MNDSLYEKNFAGWTEQQAAILRELQHVPGLDVQHLVEELEALGRRDVSDVRGLVRQAMAHMIKIAASPDADAVHRWRDDANTYVFDAQDQYCAAYRRRIDMNTLWKTAQVCARDELVLHGVTMLRLPYVCPIDLDWLLCEESYQLDDACRIIKGEAGISSSGGAND